jgi:manganese transport protein
LTGFPVSRVTHAYAVISALWAMRVTAPGGLTGTPGGAAQEDPRTGTPRVPGILGPSFVAAIACVDPGNVATNLAAGYLLVWVVVAASLAAMLVQFQAAKRGMATGRSLPRSCRDRFSHWAPV